MSTEKQFAANRRNAEKSTGPRTAAGKAKSRGNALRHGLTAKNLLLASENPAEFEALHAAMIARLRPGDPLEDEFVLRLTSILWRLRRVPAVETALIEVTTYDSQDTYDLANWGNDYNPKYVRPDKENDASQGNAQGTRLATGTGTPDAKPDPRRPPELMDVKLNPFYKEEEDVRHDERDARFNRGRVFRDLLQTDLLTKLANYESRLLRQFSLTLTKLLQLQDRRMQRESQVIDTKQIVDMAIDL